MSTSGTRAWGTLLRYVPVDSAAVTIGEVTGFGPPDVSADTIEMTSHQSTSRYREFIQGLLDGGEVGITCNAVPADAGQAAVLAHFTAGTALLMELAFPDNSAWAFSALCTGCQPVVTADIEGKLEFASTLKISGVPAWGASQAVGLTTPFFTLSEGDASLDPEPSAAAYAYTAEVANVIETLTVTPVSTGADSIEVNGTVVATTEASGAISLSVGANTIVVVCAESLHRTARYEIVVTRAAA